MFFIIYESLVVGNIYDKIGARCYIYSQSDYAVTFQRDFA